METLMLPGNRKLNLGERPMIMGILNLTFDSFTPKQDRRRQRDPSKGRKMVEDGADILDIGAESTRPGAEPCPSKRK